MEVSSDLAPAAEDVSAVWFAEDRQVLEPRYVEDEEFPIDLPVPYEWMLPPPAFRPLRRLLGLVVRTVTALLVAVFFFVLYHGPKFLLPAGLPAWMK